MQFFILLAANGITVKEYPSRYCSTIYTLLLFICTLLSNTGQYSVHTQNAVSYTG